jgi:hypothetical protein
VIHESPVFTGGVQALQFPLLHLTHRNTRECLFKSAEWTPMEAQLFVDAKVPPVTLFTLLRKMIMEVVRRAIAQGGYRDGLVGWIEALIQGMNRLLVYVQVWELQQQPSLADRYQQYELEVVTAWKTLQLPSNKKLPTLKSAPRKAPRTLIATQLATNTNDDE